MAKRSTKTAAVRTSVLGVRVQPEQRQQIEKAAVAAGTTVSAYIASVLEGAQRSARDAADSAVNSHLRWIPEFQTATSLTVAFTVAGQTPVYKDREDVNTHRIAYGNPPLIGTVPSDKTEPTSAPERIRRPIVVDRGSYRFVVRPLIDVKPSSKPDDHPDFLATPLDPAVLYELRRIGNNINQIAHAANACLPPDKKLLACTFRHLFEVLNDDEGFRRRLTAFRMRQLYNDTAHPQAGSEL